MPPTPRQLMSQQLLSRGGTQLLCSWSSPLEPGTLASQPCGACGNRLRACPALPGSPGRPVPQVRSQTETIWSVLIQAAESLRLCAMECLLHKHAGLLHLSQQPTAALSHGFSPYGICLQGSGASAPHTSPQHEPQCQCHTACRDCIQASPYAASQGLQQEWGLKAVRLISKKQSSPAPPPSRQHRPRCQSHTAGRCRHAPAAGCRA